MLGIWLLRWLLFRFMFMSGMVKLLRGDPNWWNLSALSYHFLTQPLPTPLAWYAAEMPHELLKIATGFMFCIELVLPFLIFCPRRPRFVAAFGILLLESCILVTGNYNWFNLQTMLLCLLLFDDAAIRTLMPRRLGRRLQSTLRRRAPSRPVTIVASLIALLLVFCSLVQMDERFGGSPPAAARAVDDVIGPLHLVSAYGLFAVMTTSRHEIVLQGSYDGVRWRDYEFRYKPGDVARAPRWNIPLQPRLDWQMWFAALGNPQRLPWFWRFLQRLLENEPAVTALLERNPFPGERPLYARALFSGHTIESFPDRCEEVVVAGHEIGHHGWTHVPPANMTREEEAAGLVRGSETIRKLCGSAPRGYRSPSWDLSPHTVDLLVGHGFRYDSSMMGDDYQPYWARRGDVVALHEPLVLGAPTTLVEMPISWSLDDYPHFEFLRTPTYVLPGLMNARGVLQNWSDEFLYMSRAARE